MNVFSSGSCRLVTTINHGYGKIVPIHSMFHNFVGINFLGKLHNTKQHIQFIKFIQDKITIPDHVLSKFLTSYGGCNGSFCGCEDKNLLPLKKNNIKHNFDNCEWYMFEICSLKLYKYHDFEVQHEITNEHICTIQTPEDLLNDLNIIRELIPFNKKILFQVHFRPNIIYDDSSKSIEKREIIYNVVHDFCNTHKNTFIYDPSILLKTDHSLFDGDTHFTQKGHIESFKYIFNNYIL
jgi:hypothetical protein